MSRRFRMSKRSSRRTFSRGANRVHRKNMLSSSGSKYVQRGGLRI